MRRMLGPLILAILALGSLWFMQRTDRAEDAGGTTVPVPTSHSSSGTLTPPPTPARTPPSVPALAATASASASRPTDIGLVEPEGSPVDPTAAAIPRNREQAQQFALYAAAAAAFLDDFARPDPGVSDGQWWAAVRPHLSDAAAEAYRGTDPRMVPFTKVTGPATILPTTAPSHLLRLARVPTDAGYYRVEMETDASGIRITRATPESLP